MRYGVDTSELWSLSAVADDAAAGLTAALGALAHLIDDGIAGWCLHSPAAGEMHTAAAALEDHARSAQRSAAALAQLLATAAQAYVDADTPVPR